MLKLKFNVEYIKREKRISPYIVLELKDLGVMFNKINILPETLLYDQATHLYYLVYADRSVKPSQIGLACSKNLLEWEDIGDISIHGNEKTILDAPHIMEMHGEYFIFFARVDDKISLTKRIYLAESEEITGPYKQLSNKPVLDIGKNGEFDSGRVDEPFVLYDGKFFHMLYMGAPRENINKEQVGYARADKIDGPYVKIEDNPVLKFGSSYDEFTVADPHVLEYKNIKFIFYSCSGKITGAKEYGSSPWLTAVAYTKDFKVYKKVGLLKIRTKDFSKHRSYFRGSFFVKDENLYFVYTGQDYRRHFYPMLAYAPISVLELLYQSLFPRMQEKLSKRNLSFQKDK
jgi:predicted GH43/DUF377 family glycosyl hydrolase